MKLNRHHALQLKIFSFLLFIFGVTSVFGANNNVVGLSVPLSGKAAALGRQYVAGARLALQQLGKSENIELIVSDDGCDKELAKLAIDDILNAGAELITGFLCNAPVYSALDLLKDGEMPLLISGARSNRILKDRKRNQWNVWQFAPRDADVALAASKTLDKRWHNVPFAIVDDGTVFGRTQADEFRSLMEELGNKPQFIDNFRPSQSTQAGLIRRLKKSGVEAVFLAAGADDVALIGRNMIEFGFVIEIATGEAVSLLPYIEDNKGIPVGMLSVMHSPPETLSEVQKLVGLIENEKLEPEPYLLLGYATMQIVSSYFSEPKPTFSNRNYSTVLGKVQFDDAGRNIISQYQLYRWNGKEFTLVN